MCTRSFRLAALVVAVLVFSTGCSSDSADAPLSSTASSTASTTAASSDPRANLVIAVEGTYSARHAKARWQGDTLHVRMDGKTNPIIPGWQECRVLTQLVKEGDSVVVEFADGALDCAQVLAVDD